MHPIVPSSLDILSNRRPAKLLLYDPLRYGVLSSDDRYLIAPAIIAQIGRKSKKKRKTLENSRFSKVLVLQRGLARLRAGRVAALTVPRTVIHYRSQRVPFRQQKIPSKEGIFCWNITLILIRLHPGVHFERTGCRRDAEGHTNLTLYKTVPEREKAPAVLAGAG